MSEIKIYFSFGNAGRIESSSMSSNKVFKQQYLVWEKLVIELAWSTLLSERMGQQCNQFKPDITLIPNETNKKEV
jgi:hypothetical protein